MSDLITIDVERYDAAIRSPYEARHYVKMIRGRRWDGSRKVWIIPTSEVDTAVRFLEASGYRVTVTEGGAR